MTLVGLRNTVHDHVQTVKGLAGYSQNDFELLKSWRPWSTIEELAASSQGRLYIIGTSPKEVHVTSRCNSRIKAYGIHLGYQKVIRDVNNYQEIDSLVELIEEIEFSLCQTLGLYQWVAVEYPRDEDGFPMSYVVTRNGSTFQSFMCLHYQLAIS